MSLNFPDLTITEAEKRMYQEIDVQLVERLRSLFKEEFKTEPLIRCSGSTEKGTAIPEKYFGIDFDVAVRADESLLESLAYRSNLFEGCQLFSLDFFMEFAQKFDEPYFAGHRLSGKIKGKNFDFAIADVTKDKWKWDYNRSKYLQFSPQQIEETKKAKFFLKTFNAYGSEVYGVVGPAVELLIFYYGNFEALIQKMQKFQKIEETPQTAFGTVNFPEEFYSLFPPSEDYIQQGLVRSFRYTTPNTFNRIVDAIGAQSLDVNQFLIEHNPRFNYQREVGTDSNRLIAYFLGTMIQDSQTCHIDILTGKDSATIYAAAEIAEQKTLDEACNLIDRLQKTRELNLHILPEKIRKDIERKCAGQDPERYTFFIGSPQLPLVPGRIYIPFDFLVRVDAYKLIKVMEAGQIGT